MSRPYGAGDFLLMLTAEWGLPTENGMSGGGGWCDQSISVWRISSYSSQAGSFSAVI